MLTDQEKTRYARHLLLPQFGEEAQERLFNSKVLLVGAGGLGSPCALYLVSAGVGQLTIIDPDEVELSNLQRQILHNEQSVGKAKVDSAKVQLNALNSETEVVTLHEAITSRNALSLISDNDLVVDGSDNFPTRFLVNDACHFGKKPLVYGSIFQYEGQMTVFDTAKGSPCYRCLVPDMPEDGAVPNCLEAGVIGTLPGVIGSLQAMEATKLLCNIGSAPTGKMLYYNALDTEFRTISISKDDSCPLCSNKATIKDLSSSYSVECGLNQDITSISALQLKARMEEDPNLFLIDVREPKEFVESRIPKSHLIPLRALEGHISSLPSDQTIYIHCKSGGRSKKACEILLNNRVKNIVNVYDGIDGWEN